MAVSKGSKTLKPYQRVLRFPQAKGKIISEVHLSVSPGYYTVDIRFQDKTVLTFDLESCVTVFPELLDWKNRKFPLAQTLAACSQRIVSRLKLL